MLSDTYFFFGCGQNGQLGKPLDPRHLTVRRQKSIFLLFFSVKDAILIEKQKKKKFHRHIQKIKNLVWSDRQTDGHFLALCVCDKGELLLFLGVPWWSIPYGLPKRRPFCAEFSGGAHRDISLAHLRRSTCGPGPTIPPGAVHSNIGGVRTPVVVKYQRVSES